MFCYYPVEIPGPIYSGPGPIGLNPPVVWM